MEPDRDMIKESENIELGSEVESSQGWSKCLVFIFLFCFWWVNFQITIELARTDNYLILVKVMTLGNFSTWSNSLESLLLYIIT